LGLDRMSDAPAQVFDGKRLDKESPRTFFEGLRSQPRIPLSGGRDRRRLDQGLGGVLQQLQVSSPAGGPFYYRQLVTVVSQRFERPRVFGDGVYLKAQLVEISLNDRALFWDGIDY